MVQHLEDELALEKHIPRRREEEERFAFCGSGWGRGGKKKAREGEMEIVGGKTV